MRITIYLLIASITIFAHYSCNKEDEGNPPVSYFKVDINKVEVGFEVNFTDFSGFEPTSWFWEFGDGITSKEQNPTHTYKDIGNYNVSLTVKNAHGSNVKTIENFVEVTPGQKPEAGFKLNQPLAVFNKSLVFTDTSINKSAMKITSWLWDFGDGNTSEEQNPAHTYLETGKYSITLRVENINGEATIKKDIKVYYNYAIDIDSNWYGIAKIGDQQWFSQDLKTTHYNDDSEIKYINLYNNSYWTGIKEPVFSEDLGYFYYPEVDRNYELVYNQYTVKKGNLCPEGFHVPTLEEWDLLKDNLNGNTALFEIYPNNENYYWSSSEYDEESAYCFFIDGDSSFNIKGQYEKPNYQHGRVKCLKN